jgi:hypothetical protein
MRIIHQDMWTIITAGAISWQTRPNGLESSLRRPSPLPQNFANLDKLNPES